jgi:hypothetical protein
MYLVVPSNGVTSGQKWELGGVRQRGELLIPTASLSPPQLEWPTFTVNQWSCTEHSEENQGSHARTRLGVPTPGLQSPRPSWLPPTSTLKVLWKLGCQAILLFLLGFFLVCSSAFSRSSTSFFLCALSRLLWFH